MPQEPAQNENSFEILLRWITKEGDQPGEAYEKLRSRLLKIFYARGCRNADELADETIDRVTNKLDELVDNYEGDPSLYFYGVAKNVFRESLRKPEEKELPLNLTEETVDTETLEIHDRCLSRCLDKLDDDSREFILDYYKGDKSVKIENRQKIMDKLDLTPQALRVRAFRTRAKLQECVFSCVEACTA